MIRLLGGGDGIGDGVPQQGQRPAVLEILFRATVFPPVQMTDCGSSNTFWQGVRTRRASRQSD